MTIGDEESNDMAIHQDRLIMKQLPHFIKIPVDMSGESNLKIYLWKKKNKVKGCLIGDMQVCIE